MSNDTFLFRFQWATGVEAEIIKFYFFLRHEKYCTSVGGFANATLHHYSKSSEHSPNSLQRWLSCSVHGMQDFDKTDSRKLQFGISD